MVISEKAYQIALQVREGRGLFTDEGLFPLMDAISDVLWTAFGRRWSKEYADVQEALNDLDDLLLWGWFVKENKRAKIMSLVNEAISEGYEWHTPLNEATDRRKGDAK